MAVGDKLVTLDGLKAVYQELNGNTNDLKSAVDELTETTGTDIDLSNVIKLTDGFRINAYNGGSNFGVKQTSTSFSCSELVYIKPYTNLEITLPIGSSSDAGGLVFYDATKDPITNSGIRITTGSKQNYRIAEIAVPVGAVYVGITWWNSTNTLYNKFKCIGISDGVPNYYFANNYLPGKIETINNNRIGLSANSIEFAWFTDLHVYDVNGSARNGLQSVNLCRYLAKNANITTVYCGGDLVDNRTNDGMTKAKCLDVLGKVRKYLDPIWANTYMIVGNHEWNDPNGQVDTNRLTIGAIKPAIAQDSYKHKNAQTIFNNKTSLYGSYAVDDGNYKVRTIFLGCSNSNSLYKAEYEWLAEVLRTTPSGYNVLMMSHIGFAEAPQTSAALLDRFALVVGMLEAAESKNEEYSFTLGTTRVGPFDFSGCNLSVIACITGHTHFDLSMVTTGGTLVISTTADAGPGPGSSEEYRNARILGTITEQAVDVVQIDLDNKKIFMTRIGGSFDGSAPLANPDREFSF